MRNQKLLPCLPNYAQENKDSLHLVRVAPLTQVTWSIKNNSHKGQTKTFYSMERGECEEELGTELQNRNSGNEHVMKVNNDYGQVASTWQAHGFQSNFYKPGWVMSTTQRDIIGQKSMDGSDPPGQWVYTKYTTKEDKIVTIVAAYQPCKASKLTGTTTYYQQIAMLKQQHQNVETRKVFLTDLLTWLKAGQKKGEKFIIREDFKDTMDLKFNLIKLCKR
eukprot:973182-Ditylum_brightwellii.AAC.1